MRELRSARLSAFVALAASLAAGSAALLGQGPADTERQVDRVFARWSSTTPGCAVGVAEGSRTVLAQAYGMSDLDHDLPNRPDTIFEGGSVSKQFTAAAVLLLARDGKLSLDDLARKYLPELPDYGTPLTIRHMLTHTSGLRDWGSVASVAGWPRTSRVHTHAHVLDIVSRQRALNFAPGSRWSYTNTGYNLAAIIVSRVSGTTFEDFTRTRIFEPLGMTRTSWRTDHTRIVKGRAVAYSKEADGFHILMPFERVHGNGGLLTTVEDLLKWNANFVSHRVGDAAFVAQQERPGTFSDGRPHGYAMGLQLESYKGMKEIAHGGSTAGYAAYLTRFPDERLSVAVLCNLEASEVNATAAARSVADVYLRNRLRPSTPLPHTYRPTAPETGARAGLYVSASGLAPLRIVSDGADGGSLRIERGPALTAISASSFVTSTNDRVDFDSADRATVTDQFGTVERYARTPSVKPAPEQLKALEGTYVSYEAETTLTVVLEGAKLVIKRRPDTVLALTPLYADAFEAPSLGTVVFRRDGSGRVSGLSTSSARMWDLRFSREP